MGPSMLFSMGVSVRYTLVSHIASETRYLVQICWPLINWAMVSTKHFSFAWIKLSMHTLAFKSLQKVRKICYLSSKMVPSKPLILLKKSGRTCRQNLSYFRITTCWKKKHLIPSQPTITKRTLGTSDKKNISFYCGKLAGQTPLNPLGKKSNLISSRGSTNWTDQ